MTMVRFEGGPLDGLLGNVPHASYMLGMRTYTSYSYQRVDPTPESPMCEVYKLVKVETVKVVKPQ